jgi:hypothetical protein
MNVPRIGRFVTFLSTASSTRSAYFAPDTENNEPRTR